MRLGKTQARQDLDPCCLMNHELGFDMDKQRKWPLFAIIAVIALTVYNILPTIFYYSKPLKQPIELGEPKKSLYPLKKESINSKRQTKTGFILLQFAQNQAKIDWNPPRKPQFLTVSFIKSEEAAQFRTFLPRAGSLIPACPGSAFPFPNQTGKRSLNYSKKNSGPFRREFSFPTRKTIKKYLKTESNN